MQANDEEPVTKTRTEEEEGEASLDTSPDNDGLYAMAMDLRKHCDVYALDVAQFTKIAYAHDFRRSEIFRLLKKFGFVGGIVNPRESGLIQQGICVPST